MALEKHSTLSATEYNAAPGKVIQRLVSQMMKYAAVELTGKFCSINIDSENGSAGGGQFLSTICLFFTLFIVYLTTLLVCQAI
jgi:hypothetical protein